MAVAQSHRKPPSGWPLQPPSGWPPPTARTGSWRSPGWPKAGVVHSCAVLLFGRLASFWSGPSASADGGGTARLGNGREFFACESHAKATLRVICFQALKKWLTTSLDSWLPGGTYEDAGVPPATGRSTEASPYPPHLSGEVYRKVGCQSCGRTWVLRCWNTLKVRRGLSSGRALMPLIGEVVCLVPGFTDEPVSRLHRTQLTLLSWVGRWLRCVGSLASGRPVAGCGLSASGRGFRPLVPGFDLFNNPKDKYQHLAGEI